MTRVIASKAKALSYRWPTTGGAVDKSMNNDHICKYCFSLFYLYKMSINKVSIDYSRETDNGLLVFAQSVYTALNPNTNFVWEATVMPAFELDIQNYRTSLNKAVNGTSADVLKKNLDRTQLLGTLRSIANEVNYQAKGDLVKLQSSGLRMVKGHSKVGVLPKPTGFKVQSGENSGSFFFTVDSHPNTNSYLFFSALVPAPLNLYEWREISSPTHSTTAIGFIQGKQYEMKAAYQGSEKELIFSDSIFIYAQ